MMRHSCALAFLGLLLAAVPAASLVHVVVADHYLAQQADAIVLGQVLASSVSDDIGMITTNYEISIEEVFKGFVGDLPIMVRVQGGYLPEEDRETVVFGTPTFSNGERVLLFLSWDSRWGYRILHVNQGVFYERLSGGERFFVRPLDEPFEAALAEIQQEIGGERIAIARNADDFQTWLWEADFSSDRADRYLEFLPAAAEERLFESAFTLFRDRNRSNVVLRWGANMTWKVDNEGIKGVFKSKKLLREFKKLIKRWNKQTNKTFTQKVEGTSGAKNNFVSDGMNVVQGSDPGSVLTMGDYVCGVGGTLGTGVIGAAQPESTSASAVRWKNRKTRQILEVGIIMNDNIACAGRKVDRERVRITLFHEVGHAIGIGHHCGDKLTPQCSLSPAWRKSLMLGDPFSGSISLKAPKLDEEDRHAARFLYDPDPLTPVPCAKEPPGDKRFCKPNVCGKCGRGQGHCKSDKQCLPGLECKKDTTRAGVLGVPANRKFCVEDKNCNSCPLDLPGQWEATEIEGAIDANGNPLTITGSVSTWTFNADGTYSWFLHALPFFDLDGTGTYSLDGNLLTVTGIIANTLFSETSGSKDVISLAIGNGTFRFQDEEGDHWTYAKAN